MKRIVIVLSGLLIAANASAEKVDLRQPDSKQVAAESGSPRQPGERFGFLLAAQPGSRTYYDNGQLEAEIIDGIPSSGNCRFRSFYPNGEIQWRGWRFAFLVQV